MSDSDVISIAEGIFASEDRSVINWEGENYYRDRVNNFTTTYNADITSTRERALDAALKAHRDDAGAGLANRIVDTAKVFHEFLREDDGD